MQISKILGAGAASTQALGLVFYSEIWNVPFFSFFPKIIGSALFVLSGALWFAEAFMEELPDPSISRWNHIRSKFKKTFSNQTPAMVWGAAAGLFALVASLISLTALFVGTGPFGLSLLGITGLYWAIAAAGTISGYSWFKAAGAANDSSLSPAEITNKFASSFHLLSVGFGLAALLVSTVFPPLTLAFALTSALTWLGSYFMKEPAREVVGEVKDVNIEEGFVDEQGNKGNRNASDVVDVVTTNQQTQNMSNHTSSTELPSSNNRNSTAATKAPVYLGSPGGLTMIGNKTIRFPDLDNGVSGSNSSQFDNGIK